MWRYDEYAPASLPRPQRLTSPHQSSARTGTEVVPGARRATRQIRAGRSRTTRHVRTLRDHGHGLVAATTGMPWSPRCTAKAAQPRLGHLAEGLDLALYEREQCPGGFLNSADLIVGDEP